MSFRSPNVGAAARHFVVELLQFVGLVVVSFWITNFAAFWVLAGILDGHAGFRDWVDMGNSILFYATLWIVPAFIVVAAHVLFVRSLRPYARRSVRPWIAAVVLLPLTPASLSWWGYVDLTSVGAMLVLGPLLFLYGWRAGAASNSADRSPWIRRVERFGLILGSGYFIAFTIILAGIWLEALL